jgi:hypothetical protein
MGVTKIVFTPNNETATFMTGITAQTAPAHDAAWYDLDLSAFTSGGTITIVGSVGASGCEASSYLVSECDVFPTSGGGFSTLQNKSDVPAGTQWMMSYQFSPVAVLHFGTEGDWLTT